MGVYIIKLKISSEHRQENTEEKDDKTVQITYKFPKKVRDKIRNIRVNTHQRVYSYLIRFEEGIYIGTEEHIKAVKPIVEEADQQLKEIHEELGAKLKLLPLDQNEIMKGEYYAEVVYAIYTKVIEDFLKRISKLKVDNKGNLSEKAIEGINRLLDSLHEINFLNDSMVAQRIEELRENVLKHDINTLKEELSRELKEIEKKRESMFAFLEIS